MNDCAFLSKNNSCMIDGAGWYACFVDDDEPHPEEWCCKYRPKKRDKPTK